VSPTFPQSQVGLGILCVFGVSARLPIGERIRFYNSLTDVANDFSTTDPEYLAAQAAFGQNPAPNTIAIARRFNAAVPGELLGSTTCSKTMSDYTAIATGALSLKVDGATKDITGINLTALTTLNAVASAVQTALAAASANSTVIYDGERFIVRSGTTGADSSVGFATAAPAGTDLAQLLGLRQTDGAVSTQGSAIETVTQSLDAVQTINPKWYGFILTSEATVQNIKDAAAWAETQMKMFGYTTADGTVVASAVTDDVASALKSSKYNRTMGQWDSTMGYDIASIMACLFTTDFTQPNSTKTLKFKLEPGITPITISETQRQTLESKSINYYTYFGDSAMFTPGVMASGRFADEVYGLDALQNDIQTEVFGYLYSSTTKIPQTDKGMARIVQVIEKVLYQYVSNGFLAPGTWEGQDVGQVKNGEFLPKGFYVYAQPVAQQSQADRAARKAPPITIICTGAGAIHSISINLIFQR
jgi:hypothetical protein